jgi:hypothetical protein
MKGRLSDTNIIQRIIGEYFKNLYFNKSENLEEMDNFLDASDLPKLKYENIDNLTDV